MDAFEDRFRNSQSNVPSLVTRASLSYDKHTSLIFEKLTNLIGAQVPHFRDFGHSIVPFGMGRVDKADGAKFFGTVLGVVCHRHLLTCMVYTYSI
jgi:hypothetical protein